MHRPQTHTGFTVIELLLYIGILSIMLTAVSGFIAVFLDARVKNQTIADVEITGNQVLQILLSEIATSQSVSQPLPQSSAAVLDVVLAAGSGDTEIAILDGAIVQTAPGGSPVALTSSHVTASDLQISNRASAGQRDALAIEFILTHVNPANQQRYSYQQTFRGSVQRLPQ